MKLVLEQYAGTRPLEREWSSDPMESQMLDLQTAAVGTTYFPTRYQVVSRSLLWLLAACLVTVVSLSLTLPSLLLHVITP